MVALAAIYNDMKDLVALSYEMRATLPNGKDSSVAAGEWRGRQSTLHRFKIGVLYELLVLIKKKKSVVKLNEFEEILQTMEPEHRGEWSTIADVALDRGGADSSSLRKRLAYIRNNAAFHYWALHEIGKAWKQFFQDAAKTEFNRTAVYCLGNSMETTRFHFADAAMQAVARCSPTGRSSSDGGPDQIDEVAKKVNVALRFLLEKFLERRNAASR
jgi:hypothetical protein